MAILPNRPDNGSQQQHSSSTSVCWKRRPAAWSCSKNRRERDTTHGKYRGCRRVWGTVRSCAVCAAGWCGGWAADLPISPRSLEAGGGIFMSVGCSGILVPFGIKVRLRELNDWIDLMVTGRGTLHISVRHVLIRSLHESGIKSILCVGAFCGKNLDRPDQPMEFS